MPHYIVSVTTRDCAICGPTRTTRWIIQASLPTLAEVKACREYEKLYDLIKFGTAKATLLEDTPILIDNTYHHP